VTQGSHKAVKGDEKSGGGSAPAPSKPHRYRMPDGDLFESDDVPDAGTQRRAIEPWLSALFQSEHLSLLLGNGFSMGVAFALGAPPATMAGAQFKATHHEKVDRAAAESAERMGRGKANFEDQIRSANELLTGLRVLGEDKLVGDWSEAIRTALKGLLGDVLKMEQGIARTLEGGKQLGAEDVLSRFLLAFAARSSSRERLSLFTTNYDRLVEFGAERIGVRVLDRFVGTLHPVFRSSRLDIDFHYNPPGIRGEPRFLEGVVKYAKLHGSIDWRFERARARRIGVPFGAELTHPAFTSAPFDQVVVFPNSSKDVETSAFPYSELFRDFSAAICRPNSVLVVYGYGFGDTHINDAIRDMLTIPSTHLVIISYDDASGRVPSFISGSEQQAQISFMLGSHFGDLRTLVDWYLPKPAIDRISQRRVDLLRARSVGPSKPVAEEAQDEGGPAVLAKGSGNDKRD